MKILDPQSAILTNAEVLHFLHTHPLRKPDLPVGSYVPTSQHGHATIRRDLLTYFRETAPCTQTLADKFQSERYLSPKSTVENYHSHRHRHRHNGKNSNSSSSKTDDKNEDENDDDETKGWVRVLMERLAPYELTKGEVVMAMNLGLGLQDWQARMPPRLRGGEDGVRSDAEQRASDEWVLGAVCEELEQRFGSDKVNAILDTVGEVVAMQQREGTKEIGEEEEEENGSTVEMEKVDEGGVGLNRTNEDVYDRKTEAHVADTMDESEDVG